MAKLFDKDSDSDGELKFNTTTNYANNYDRWRRKEMLQKLKDRYGDQDQDEDDDSGSEEDEEGIEWTPQVEKDFFRTLACLKRDDAIVYDTNHKFFAEREEPVARPKPEKPMFLRDFERKRILEHGGLDVDEEDPGTAHRSQSPSLAQEQRDLKASFRTAMDSGSDTEDLLVPRKREPQEVEAEEATYAAWLKGKVDKLGDKRAEEDLKSLRDFWTDPKLAEGESFLKDYVLNKRYQGSGKLLGDERDISDDDTNVEKMEDFERLYNFRFEEPDATLIKTYPRTMENSVRLKDTRRSEKRKATKSRHEQQREQKVQELMQLKALKRMEIQERIEALKKSTGNDTLAFQDSDVEGEFDPSKHDERMEKLFDNPYYAEEEEEKPVFSDMDDDQDLENWDEYGQPHGQPAGRANGQPASRGDRQTAGDGEEGEGEEEEEAAEEEEAVHCEDENFNMDADYDPTANAKRKAKRLRQKPKLWAALTRPHPTFDPAHGSFDAFVDEYYKMDFEDIIGDLPCRYKYRQVPANDYGLTIDEILRADDKELNAWASIKKATTLLPYWLEAKDKEKYDRLRNDEKCKRKKLTSLYQPIEVWEGPENSKRGVWTGPKKASLQKTTEGGVKKRKKAGGKKKRGLGKEGWKEGERGDDDIESYGAIEGELDGGAKKKKKKSRGAENELEAVDRLENEEPKKKKKKKRHEQEEDVSAVDLDVRENEEVKKKKKKKRHEEEEDVTAVDLDVQEYGEAKKKKKKKNKGQEIELELSASAEGLENGEVKKKKKKKNQKEDNNMETSTAGEVDELEHGKVKKKKKKKHQIEENNMETSTVGDVHELVNGDVKKKKKRKEPELEENGFGLENGGVEKKEKTTSKRKKHQESEIAEQCKNTKETDGEQRKAKKRKLDEEEVTEKEGGNTDTADEKLSRRKKKNNKLAEKRKIDPTVPAKKKKKKPKPQPYARTHFNRYDNQYPVAPFREQEPENRFKHTKVEKDELPEDPESGITKDRLAAYGVTRPKRYLGYLKYK